MSADEPPRTRRSYDYTTRRGAREVSWEEFAAMCAQLAETLAARKIDTIVGIARAGLFPATAVASALRCELYPVRLTRRLHDEVVYDSPVWRVPVSPLIEGKAVAIVDEIADTGETLALVAAQARDLRAERVVTACLVTPFVGPAAARRLRACHRRVRALPVGPARADRRALAASPGGRRSD